MSFHASELCQQQSGSQHDTVFSPALQHAPPIVNKVLRSPGQSLDASTRAVAESRFGHDFSAVRVHADAEAAKSAQAVDALAYTVGRDMVFGAGQYQPHNAAGQQLLVHELTHVVQQRNSALPAGDMRLGYPDSPHEHEAAAAAVALENGRSPAITSAAPALQRQPRTHITAPVPKGATVNKQGQASFQINGIDVIAEPDTTSTDEARRDKAETKFGLLLDQEADGQYDSRTNTITSVTPPHIHATVYTVFGPGYDPHRSATYGRGTTKDDIKAGNRNLGFHESRHGADWFEFMRQNPAPVFSGKAGMSLDDFQKAREQFHVDIDKYNLSAQDYTKRMTDCTGTLPKERNLATFCRQQRP